MKSYLLATASMVAFAAVPATARDHAAYVGLEAGPMWPQDSQIRIVTHFNGMTFVSSPNTSHKAGIDGDLVGGYDFGIVRAEVEGAQKWADHDESCDRGNCVDALGHTRARSLMGNALVELGKDAGINVYAGGGVGIAWLRQKFAVSGGPGSSSIQGNGVAWQLIAGARSRVSRHLDVGLKYRYFQPSKISGDFADATVSFSVRSNFRSHSLLASLIYTLGRSEAPSVRPDRS